MVELPSAFLFYYDGFSKAKCSCTSCYFSSHAWNATFSYFFLFSKTSSIGFAWFDFSVLLQLLSTAHSASLDELEKLKKNPLFGRFQPTVLHIRIMNFWANWTKKELLWGDKKYNYYICFSCNMKNWVVFLGSLCVRQWHIRTTPGLLESLPSSFEAYNCEKRGEQFSQVSKREGKKQKHANYSTCCLNKLWWLYLWIFDNSQQRNYNSLSPFS